MNRTIGTSDTRGERDATIPNEDVFEVLSNRRRRFVIHALKRADDPPDVTELSRYVAAWELGTDPEDVPYEYRHNVYSTLKRTHLPKLREKDIVTVDEDDVVRPAPGLEQIEVYVEVLRGREIPWSLYYLGLTGFAAALLVAVALDVPGFAVLSPIGVGTFAATAFAISAVVHHVVGRRMQLGNTERPPAARRRQ